MVHELSELHMPETGASPTTWRLRRPSESTTYMFILLKRKGENSGLVTWKCPLFLVSLWAEGRAILLEDYYLQINGSLKCKQEEQWNGSNQLPLVTLSILSFCSILPFLLRLRDNYQQRDWQCVKDCLVSHKLAGRRQVCLSRKVALISARWEAVAAFAQCSCPLLSVSIMSK